MPANNAVVGDCTGWEGMNEWVNNFFRVGVGEGLFVRRCATKIFPLGPLPHRTAPHRSRACQVQQGLPKALGPSQQLQLAFLADGKPPL